MGVGVGGGVREKYSKKGGGRRKGNGGGGMHDAGLHDTV